MLRDLLRTLRPTQWVKNLFVLGPLLFAHRLGDRQAVVWATFAVLLWSVVASAVYLMNDLVDAEEDRQHPQKRNRPIASGALPAWVAVLGSVVLGGGGLTAAFFLDASLGWVLGVYVVLNVGYTFGLRRVVILDAMFVASGFVLRVLSGSWVIDVPPSAWLLVCTGLLALFLGFAKRRQEFVSAAEGRTAGRSVLSEYTLPFLDMVQSVLAATTAMAYAIYCVSPDTIARVGDMRMLLTAPLVLYGLFRYLYLVLVRGAGENPTRVAVTDPGIIFTVVLWACSSALLVYL